MNQDTKWFQFVPIFMRLQQLIRENNARARNERNARNALNDSDSEKGEGKTSRC